MNTRLLRRIASGLALLSLAACSYTAPTTPTPMVAGAWQGQVASLLDGPGSFTLQLAQTGTDVSGTLVLSQGGIANVSAALTGTLSGYAGAATLPFTITYVYGANCQGTFAGTLNVTDQTMSGTYSGHDCAHTFDGTIQATKNQ